MGQGGLGRGGDAGEPAGLSQLDTTAHDLGLAEQAFGAKISLLHVRSEEASCPNEPHDISSVDSKAAESEAFAIMVTCDQNIRYQQTMTNRPIGLVILSTNDWNVLRREAEKIRQAIDCLPPRGYDFIECGLP